jgi:hypothetical protein
MALAHHHGRLAAPEVLARGAAIAPRYCEKRKEPFSCG